MNVLLQILHILLLNGIGIRQNKFNLASTVGKVLWEEASDNCDAPPRFCVGLDLTQGWVSVVLAYSPASGHAIIQVEYDSVQLHCPRCHSHQHGQDTYPNLPRSSPAQGQEGSDIRNRPPRDGERSSDPSSPRDRNHQNRGHRSRRTWNHPARRQAHRPNTQHHRRRPQRNRRFSPPPRPVPDTDGFIPVLHRRQLARRHGLDWPDWRAREQLRGCISPPYPSEFTDDVKLAAAQNEYQERRQWCHAREGTHPRDRTAAPQVDPSESPRMTTGARSDPPPRRCRPSRWDIPPARQPVETPQRSPFQGIGRSSGSPPQDIHSENPPLPAAAASSPLPVLLGEEVQNPADTPSFAPLAAQPSYAEVYGPFSDHSNSGPEAMDIDTEHWGSPIDLAAPHSSSSHDNQSFS
jgi:hypothetical protein